jgi:hypothetical protein
MEEYFIRVPITFNGRTSNASVYVWPKRLLTGVKGIAQLEWRQALWVEGPLAVGPLPWPRPTQRRPAPIQARTTVEFDASFDDIRASPTGLVKPEAIVRRFDNTNSATAEPDPGTIYSGQGIPHAALVVRATSSQLKDLLDLVVFGMSALFGAAAAALFEIASSAIARRRGL